jgi:hypothetical protein
MRFERRMRRPDREKLVQNLPGYPHERTRQLESWDLWLTNGFEASLIAAYEDIAPRPGIPDWRWHLSVSGMERIPTWEELAFIVHETRPGIVFTLALPPRSWWINVAEYCLHAWEIHDTNLTDLWRSERRGDTPS